jgi:putative acetyltransferase
MMVLINSKEYLEDFIRLNEAWITRYFALEKADGELARNPYKVIEDGGYVFTLLVKNNVVGVCALFKSEDGAFQLARMAVSPEHQGKGYGDKLLNATFDKLREIKAGRVYLLSNTKLTSAIALYKKHGFTTVSKGWHPVYARVDIVMEKRL